MERVALSVGWLLSLVVAGGVLAGPAHAGSYWRIHSNDESVWIEVSPIRFVGDEGSHPYAGPDLAPYAVLPEGADLGSADLERANLYYASLDEANLAFASLRRANLGYALLRSASFESADLALADLSYADLEGAEMRNANLERAEWSHAIVDGTDLRGADLAGSLYLGLTIGSAYYDHGTDFSDARNGAPGSGPFDPEASGWIRLPEPSAGLLSIVAIATLGVLRSGRRSILGDVEARTSRPRGPMRT